MQRMTRVTMAVLLAAILLAGCAGSGKQTPDEQPQQASEKELTAEQKEEARRRMIEAARAPADSSGRVETKPDDEKGGTKYQLRDLRLLDESGPEKPEFDSVDEKAQWIGTFQNEEREEIALEAQWRVPDDGAADETVTVVARSRSFAGKRYEECHGFDLVIDGQSIEVSSDIQYDGFVITGKNVAETVAMQVPVEGIRTIAQGDSVTVKLCESEFTLNDDQRATFATYWKTIEKERSSEN